ncbi:Hint domain-containing protein [uncultured Paracoccus sp.]|uniref:Hint domain-containing protein n=1 Tax=uncultured Paracoccus sp. TaxID=189685 RepID=UPI0025EAE079|nr:Hint domain-containing protein [uncultured Paracoccus sp.]
MADFTINADSFGAFYENVGNNGTDDNVTVNIGPNFSGTITVDSQPADGEYDNTTINIPDGWRLEVVNLVEDDGTEDPSFKDISYKVFRADGSEAGTLSIRANNIQGAPVPCFARGTLIDTPDGPTTIEDLKRGDLVLTRDNGPQPIRWIGSTKLAALQLMRNGKLRPIRIVAGALGNGLPSSDLMVSPQHRVLVRSRIAQKMFGTDEVLVAAKQLLQVEGVDIAADIESVEYFHMLFDRHEVVVSNGAETESLYTGPEALKALPPAAVEEIFTLFPELRAHGHKTTPARVLASGRRGRNLAIRHIQNGKALVATP